MKKIGRNKLIGNLVKINNRQNDDLSYKIGIIVNYNPKTLYSIYFPKFNEIYSLGRYDFDILE